MPKHYAIVPAAGSGSRFGAEIPKQYLPLGAQPLIFHTLAALAACAAIDRISVILSPDDAHWRTFDWRPLGDKVAPLFAGGTTRAATVLGGLEAIAGVAEDDDWVLVHDAARPCLSLAVLVRLVTELTDDPVGGILAIPVADTLKREGANGRISATEPREGLWQAQTPQMFRYGLLRDALRRFGGVTDEAGAMEAAGHAPRLIRGDATNLKVTFAADLELAALILESRQ